MKATKWKIGILSLVLSATFAFNSFAEWQQAQDGSWKFYNVDGTIGINKWAKSGEDWYHFDNEGHMEHSTIIVDGDGTYYVDDVGKMVKNQWVNQNEKYYYAGEDGKILKNTITPDGYTVDSNGIWNQSIPQISTILNNLVELNQYLYDNYRIIHTNLGDIEVGHKDSYGGYSGNYAIENTTIREAYDYQIITMRSIMFQKQYNEVMDSLEYTTDQKNEFKQCLKNYQYNMAKDIISKMPGKKIEGGFFHEYYDYRYTKVGYHASWMFKWCNYKETKNSLEGYYYNFTVSDFQWLED
jgi:hypothetical protein